MVHFVKNVLIVQIVYMARVTLHAMRREMCANRISDPLCIPLS